MSEGRPFENFVKDLESDEEIKEAIRFARKELSEFKERRKQAAESGNTDILGLQVEVAVEIMTLHNWHLCAQGLVTAIDANALLNWSSLKRAEPWVRDLWSLGWITPSFLERHINDNR